MSVPTAPGWYWVREGSHSKRPRAWEVVHVTNHPSDTRPDELFVHMEGELFDIESKHWAEWGPRLHPPEEHGCPTESCSECGGRGWEYARPIT